MGIWADYIKYGWPILTGVAAFMVMVASLLLNSRFVTRAEHNSQRRAADEAHEERDRRIAEHAERIALLEDRQKEPPTRHDLAKGLGTVLERMSKLEAIVESQGKRVDREFDGLSKQLGTLNAYLQALIEKGLGK